MLILPIALPSGETVVVAPTPYLQLGAYEVLRAGLLQYWESSEHCWGELAADDRVWCLVQQIISLLPRQDRPGSGFSLGDDYLWLERFLFVDLVQLHKVDEIEPTAADEDTQPVPSSGDPLADMVADLSMQHGMGDAIAGLERFDLNTMNKVLFRLNENVRDPKERQNAALQADYDDWKTVNPHAYLPRMNLANASRPVPNGVS
jgi:hypothetical protein